MKKENALMKIGRAVSEYLKGTPALKKSDRRNQPAHNHNSKQFKPRRSRHEEYREEQKAQNLNVARSLKMFLSPGGLFPCFEPLPLGMVQSSSKHRADNPSFSYGEEARNLFSFSFSPISKIFSEI